MRASHVYRNIPVLACALAVFLWVRPAICLDALRIPYTTHRDRIVLPVTVGESRTLRVLLDSGMGSDGLLLYNPALRDSITLPDVKLGGIGGAGGGPGSSARFSDSAAFRVGSLECAPQRVIMLEGEAFRGFPSDGVTGHSLLGHYVVRIDRERRELVLTPPGGPRPDSTWTALPLDVKPSGIPWVTITASLAGRDSVVLACYVDLASSETLELLTGPSQRFETPAGLEEVVLGRGLSGDVRGSRGELAWLRIGSQRVEHPRAAFTPASLRSKQAGADAVMGSGLLARFDCIFDYAGRTMYVRPARGTTSAR